MWSGPWRVGERSDRTGVRLVGPPLALDGPELVSYGMVWGAIEVPSGGQPIILLADHPTVGGYPVVAVVASVDRPALGQLRPGDDVRFDQIDVASARGLRLESEKELAEAASRLRMARPIG
jgi:antagonist of KipI